MDATNSAQVRLKKATIADECLVKSLLASYLEELSAYGDYPVESTGPVVYRYLDEYWRGDSRHAFIILHEESEAGFVFVRTPRSTGTAAHQIAEFYIKPKFRRLHVGRSSAAEIWKRFPGQWELEVHEENSGAVVFWREIAYRAADSALRVERIQADDGFRFHLHFRTNRNA